MKHIFFFVLKINNLHLYIFNVNIHYKNGEHSFKKKKLITNKLSSARFKSKKKK